jgi:hypothetical protein
MYIIGPWLGTQVGHPTTNCQAQHKHIPLVVLSSSSLFYPLTTPLCTYL